VRSVAQALELDAAPLLALLDAQAGAVRPAARQEPAPAQVAVPTGSLRVPAAPPERRGPRWGAALVAALSVLVAVLAVGTLTGEQDRTPSAAEELFTEASPAPTSAPAASPRPSPRPLAAAVRPTSGARMRVRVLQGSSWVRVQGSGGTLFEGVFAAGQPPKDFADARQLRLLVGNAAALSVVCGSKDLAPAGGAGAVRRFTCSASGLVAA
jgi:hypothetical protein